MLAPNLPLTVQSAQEERIGYLMLSLGIKHHRAAFAQLENTRPLLARRLLPRVLSVQNILLRLRAHPVFVIVLKKTAQQQRPSLSSINAPVKKSCFQ
jgi:hypothetical protein